MRRLPLAILLALASSTAIAWELYPPDVATRNNALNFKDLALTICIAKAFPGAAADAGRTAGALHEWGRHDLEEAPTRLVELVGQFLARTYQSKQNDGVRMDMLKCLDLYHSPELENLTAQFVPDPDGRAIDRDRN